MAHNLEAKIVVVGSQGVGKTSLVHRYVQNAFIPPSQSTIGASFLVKRVVDIDTSTVVRLQIWDTAGQERFRAMSKLYYRGKLYTSYLPVWNFGLSHSTSTLLSLAIPACPN
jgi:small GTP-binding protein